MSEVGQIFATQMKKADASKAVERRSGEAEPFSPIIGKSDDLYREGKGGLRRTTPPGPESTGPAFPGIRLVFQ